MRTRLLLLAAPIALSLAVVCSIFVFPSTDDGSGSDAVIVLAGDSESRTPAGVELAEDGAGVLILSVPAGSQTYHQTRRLCEDPGSLTVYCIRPEPNNTQGEARAIGDLVAKHEWSRITVVTSTYHVHRARLLIERCTDSQVLMAEARPSISLERWVDLVVHEIGGTLKSTVDRPC